MSKTYTATHLLIDLLEMALLAIFVAAVTLLATAA